MKMLLEYERYNVEIAYKRHVRAGVAKTFAPDVVLLDLGLPGMKMDTKLHSNCGAMPVMRGVLLIAVSGYAQEDRQRSSGEGFDSHFKNPSRYDRSWK
jgi:CheY-like chemotaxis protein